MITVKLMGGMGNQMFQYAAALAIAYRQKTDLTLDLSFLLDKTPRPEFVFRDFDLDIFNLPKEIIIRQTPKLELPRRLTSLIFHPQLTRFLSKGLNKGQFVNFFIKKILSNFKFYVYNEPFFEFNPLVYHLPKDSYLSGYFQSPLFFKEIEDKIRQQFRIEPDLPKMTSHLAGEIKNSQSVCINVRRTDFVNQKSTNATHGFCDMGYFDKCIALLQKKQPDAKFMVFSDDIAWCQENFGGRSSFNIIDHSHKGPKFSWYLHLMTLCKHFIIPNSSFAWWAAWLSNTGGMIFAPKNWFRNPQINTSDLFPETWHLVEN